MYDKSQDNFSTALLTMVATVVGVQWKEKKTGYRSVVVSTQRRAAAPIAESKKEQFLKLSRSTFIPTPHVLQVTQQAGKTRNSHRLRPQCRFSTSLPCDHV
jgi:hypothetical protein